MCVCKCKCANFCSNPAISGIGKFLNVPAGIHKNENQNSSVRIMTDTSAYTTYTDWCGKTTMIKCKTK